MEEGDVCRMCLDTDVRMFPVTGTPLQFVYEKLTNKPLLTGTKPVTACYLCHSHLLRSYKFMQRCFIAEDVLEGILKIKPLVTMKLVALVDRRSKGLDVSMTRFSTEVECFPRIELPAAPNYGSINVTVPESCGTEVPIVQISAMTEEIHEEVNIKDEPSELPINEDMFMPQPEMDTDAQFEDPLEYFHLDNDVKVDMPDEPEHEGLMEYPICKICGFALSDDVTLIGAKGQKNLVSASQRRRDGKFTEMSEEKIQLHGKCRSAYINERCIQSAARKSERKDEIKFDYQKQCLFCKGDASEQFVTKQLRLPSNKRIMVSRFRKQDTANTILHKSLEYHDDFHKEFKMAAKYYKYCVVPQCRSTSIKTPKKLFIYVPHNPKIRKKWLKLAGRDDIESLSTRSKMYFCEDHFDIRSRLVNKDLVRLNARYHKLCYTRFLYPAKCGKRGRPVEEEVDEKMKLVHEFINNIEDSQFSMEDLRRGINGQPPHLRTLMRRLKDQYGDNLLVFNPRGEKAHFVITCPQILDEKWYINRETDEKIEKLRVVQTAANILLDDIRSILFYTDYYPPADSFLQDIDQIPDTLKVFMSTVIAKYKNNPDSSKPVVTALSHAIMSAVRPRTFISPLLLGITSYINQNRNPKMLIDLLSSFGLCLPYKEVKKFELSSMFHQQKDSESEFKQFVFDHANFYTRSIHGDNTFKFVAGIQVNTPKDANQSTSIKRLDNVSKTDAVERFGNRSLEHNFNHNKNGLRNITLQNHVDHSAVIPTLSDVLWLYGKSEPLLNAPGWNTFMSKIYKDKEYTVSNIQPLSFINATFLNKDSIYAALKEALKNTTNGLCIVTLNQPAYHSAQEIVNSNSDFRKIILRLGGLDLIKSFMGAMGYIMSGSGLKELWCTIYAAVSTEKMISGHSFARSFRAHCLTRTALFCLLVKHINVNPKEKVDIEDILDNFLNDYRPQLSKLDNPSIRKLQENFDVVLGVLEKRGPTATLWIEYFRMATILVQFVEAEKSGNWKMHLSAIRKMLPYFYASGHFAYAKSCSMYLQDMENLASEIDEVDIYKFSSVFFTIRRSDKFWSGMWADETIKQTLLRSMESSSGFIQGVTDSVLLKSISSASIMSIVFEQIENYCGVPFSENADANEACLRKDNEDLAKFLDWLKQHDPFPTTDHIVSLFSGIIGTTDVNCHEARSVGQAMMLETVGQNIKEIKYQIQKRVLPLSSVKSSIKVDDLKIPIESDTILKRVGKAITDQKELKSCLKYELAPYPLALFDENGMRKPKTSILHELCTPIDDFRPKESGALYVIDGEFLLYKVAWEKGTGVYAIVDSYVSYVKTNFENAIVVFGGHEESDTNTKMAERSRNAYRLFTPEVSLDQSPEITITQEHFLSIEKNKDQLIQYLKTEFENSGIPVNQSLGDADMLIVNTAIDNVNNCDEIFIVSDNEDLLVIMSGLTTENNIFLMKLERGNARAKYYSTYCFDDAKIKSHIFFIHAIGGCNTTSTIFRQSKKQIAKLVRSDREIQKMISIFKNPEADPIALTNAGEKFLVKLYGGMGNDLDHIRYQNFANSITKSKFDLTCLPPTAEVARQHIFRTYHQVQKWFGNEKPTTDWGWKLVDNHLQPVTPLEVVPKNILDKISCKCKKSCKSDCTCKKYGLTCSVICVNCNERTCCKDSSDDVDDDDYQIFTGCDKYGNPLDFEPVKDIVDNETNKVECESDEESRWPKRLRLRDSIVSNTQSENDTPRSHSMMTRSVIEDDLLAIE